MRRMILLLILCLQLPAQSQETPLTKIAVIKRVIQDDTKRKTAEMEMLEQAVQIESYSPPEAAFAVDRRIDMLKARVKENDLIMKSKIIELQTVRATILVMEKLSELKSKKLVDSAQIALYHTYMKVLKSDQSNKPDAGDGK